MGRTFTLQGRLSREEYWREGAALQLAAAFIGASLVMMELLGGPALGVELSLVLVLTAATFMGLMVLLAAASFALSVRRMHDLGRSGWWVCLSQVAGCAGIGISSSEASLLVCQRRFQLVWRGTQPGQSSECV
jgi:uncharacterized membrane protein YhaH (DUF805 family)